MRKLFIILLIIALLSLSACGPKSKIVDNDKAVVQEDKGDAVVADEETTVVQKEESDTAVEVDVSKEELDALKKDLDKMQFEDINGFSEK